MAHCADISEVRLIEPHVFSDERGYFLEAFNQAEFEKVVGPGVAFVQDNESYSRKSVLRGLHYQVAPHAQGKLVRCVRGAIWDVAVDFRRCSTTFGDWVAFELSEDNHKQLWIPEGFGHGFLTLTDNATVLYKTTDYYSSACERSVLWNDSDLAIGWPLDGEPILSSKDLNAPFLVDAEVFP